MVRLTTVEGLWKSIDLPEATLSRLNLSKNPDPAVNSSFRLGTAAQTSIGLSALSAAHFHELRTGVMQNVSVDARHAILEFRSESWYTVSGEVEPDKLFDELAGLYKTKDNSYVRIHTNFPHHRQGILDILQCAPTRQAIGDALLQWNSIDFETEASSRKMVATALRSFDEWDKHPQAKSLAGVPPVSLIKVGDAPKRDVRGHFSRPLEGIRVLDLTRVLAGPVCGRTLSAHGADVLLITSPALPALPFLDADTSRGKRAAQLDLTKDADKATLTSLARDTDVFLQAYRPGGMHDKGFGVENVVKLRPGIVYASLNAYGWDGPWKDRRGFDSLTQTATGFNFAEGEAFAQYEGRANESTLAVPRVFPMQALDHAAGYLLAFGIHAALCKTIAEGGSWEVRVSLAAVGQWIRSLGQLAPDLAFGKGHPLPPRIMPQISEIAALSAQLTQMEGDKPHSEPLKKMTAITHAAVLSETPVREFGSSLDLNAHLPRWLPRH